MTRSSARNRVFFTRVLDDAAHAVRCGPDSARVAQHRFHEHEGGLPSPLVVLTHVAARPPRIRLGPGVFTLPLEKPIRVARAGSSPPDAPPSEAYGMTSA